MNLTKRVKGFSFLSFIFLLVVCMLSMMAFVAYWSSSFYDTFKDERGMHMIDSHKKIKVLLIQNESSRNNIKAYLNLEGFVKSVDKFNIMEPRIIEGVGNDPVILNSVIEDAINEGIDKIFLVGFKYSLTISNIFRKYPNVLFFLYGGESNEKNVISYLPRTYNMKYLLGIIAGISTKTNEIGYIADTKASWNMRSINAFAIGVAKVNPKAKIKLAFTYDVDDVEAAKYLVNSLFEKTNIDIITGSLSKCVWCDLAFLNIKMKYIGQMVDESQGYDDRYLSSYIYNMEPIYTHFFMAISNNLPDFANNFWFGYREGVMNLGPLSSQIPEGRRKFLEKEFDLVKKDICFVYRGPIYSNEKKKVVDYNATIHDHELEQSFNWLNFNIEEFELNGNYFRESVYNYNEHKQDDVNLEILSMDEAKEILKKRPK